MHAIPTALTAAPVRVRLSALPFIISIIWQPLPFVNRGGEKNTLLGAKAAYAVRRPRAARCSEKHKARSGGADAEELGDIEEQIAIYDSTVKTGNDALDVILTEKSLTCGRNGIVIDIIADGEKLDFMAKEDIYSLFGNIMDNAIASVLGLEREERNISLSIRTSGEMLVIRESNRYGSSITFEDDLLVSQGNRRFHGFGMKSIKYVCDRYEADLAVSAENGLFTINILFPNMKALKRVPAPGEE